LIELILDFRVKSRLAFTERSIEGSEARGSAFWELAFRFKQLRWADEVK